MAESSLIVKIGADLKNFNRGMAELNKRIKESFTTSSLSRYISLWAAKKAILGGLATAAVKAAGNYQQASIAFEKLMGKAKAAQIFTDRLTDFAYSTPFDYDGLMKDAQALYQVGVAGDQIIPMLTAFSEAAAGIGKGQAEIDAMTKAVVHMQSIGEADTRTFESINRVGIPAWKMLAKAMNTTEQAAKDAVEKHMVSASKATEILVKGMNEMYAGMMKIQETKTINGALANLKGNVEHTMLEIGRIISDRSGIIPAINKASTAFDTFAKAVRDEGIDEALLKVFGPEMVALVDGLSVAIKFRAIAAVVALGNHMLETAAKADVLKSRIFTLGNVATATLAALAALVSYKASLGVEGFDIDYHPEGLSEDDEAALGSAKAAIKQAEAQEKAAKAAKAAQDAKDAMALASQNAQTNVVGPVGGSSGGRAGGGSGNSAAELENERRQKAMQAARDELSSLRAVQDAMRESMALRKAYMTAVESEAYEMRTKHEDAVQRIQDRWQEFEIAYIGMSDEERSRTIENLDKLGVAYEETAEGRLSLAAQTAADIAAEEERYAEESKNYYIQCKDLMAERDEAFRTNSLEALQALLTEENAARLNAYNTQQSVMQRFYENWLEINKTTKERVADIVMNSQSSFENFFTNVMSGAKSFGDSLLDLVNDILREIMSSIAKMMASKLINSFLSMLFPSSSGFSFIGGGGFSNWGASPFTTSRLFGATGGYIVGPGSGTSDSVPAWLSNGEYIMSADAVSRLGVPFLNALNKGQTPRFASGGAVGVSSGTYGNGAPPVVINLHNESGVAMDAQQTDATFDGESWVIGIVLNGIATNKNGMRSVLKGAMANG